MDVDIAASRGLTCDINDEEHEMGGDPDAVGETHADAWRKCWGAVNFAIRTAQTTRTTSQSAGSMLARITHTVAIPIARPKSDSEKTSLQFIHDCQPARFRARPPLARSPRVPRSGGFSR